MEIILPMINYPANIFIRTMSMIKEEVDAMILVRVHRNGKPLTQVHNGTPSPPSSIIVRFNDTSA